MPTLRTEVAAASLDDARRLVHTLKGVAGTLEIRLVAEAARWVEDALAKGDLTDIAGKLDRLEQAMLPALAAAASLRCASPPAAGVAVAVDFRASRPALTELRDLLRRRSLRARRTFDALEHTLGGTPEAAALHPVKAALDGLNYDEALIMLDKIVGLDETASGRQLAAEAHP